MCAAHPNPFNSIFLFVIFNFLFIVKLFFVYVVYVVGPLNILLSTCLTFIIIISFIIAWYNFIFVFMNTFVDFIEFVETKQKSLAVVVLVSNLILNLLSFPLFCVYVGFTHCAFRMVLKTNADIIFICLCPQLTEICSPNLTVIPDPSKQSFISIPSVPS